MRQTMIASPGKPEIIYLINHCGTIALVWDPRQSAWVGSMAIKWWQPPPTD